jgi:hypothetical protein
VPLRRRDPDLGVESDGADGFFFQIRDTQLEEEARNSSKPENFGTLYTKIQVRHRVLLYTEGRFWFSSLEYQSSSFFTSLQGV